MSEKLDQNSKTLALACDIVAAYVASNAIPAFELPGLIANVHAALRSPTDGTRGSIIGEKGIEIEKPTLAQIKKSIRPNGLISFIDGKMYQTLKLHLNGHGLDPHSYRERFGLPADYPMTAPAYSARRSALAKSIGLGRLGRMAA